MLKKNKTFYLIINCIGFFISIYGLFLNTSYATNTGTVYLTSNQEVLEKGEEIEITVNIENTKTAAFNFFIYFDDSKLEYVSGPENTNVIGNRIIFVWYDSKGGNGAKDGELAKFKLKAKEDGLTTFSIQGEFYSQAGQLIQTEFKEKQIQIGKEQTNLQKQSEEEQGTDLQNNNAALQVLRLDKEGITPSFEKENYEYYLTIDNSVQNIEVLAISENPNSVVEISGNTNLKEGLNLITIRVTSPDKTQSNVYTIQVTKTANIELANTNLEILAIENVLLNPPFDNNETNYKAEISNETNNVNLLAVPENEKAVVEISGKDNLKEGNNLITVVVTAPNGFTKKKYQVEVYKRNAEEEAKYKEEQELKKQELEEAYKIEQLSINQDEKQEEIIEENSEQKNQNGIILGSVILLGIILLIIVYLKKYRKNKIN